MTTNYEATRLFSSALLSIVDEIKNKKNEERKRESVGGGIQYPRVRV